VSRPTACGIFLNSVCASSLAFQQRRRRRCSYNLFSPHVICPFGASISAILYGRFPVCTTTATATWRWRIMIMHGWRASTAASGQPRAWGFVVICVPQAENRIFIVNRSRAAPCTYYSCKVHLLTACTFNTGRNRSSLDYSRNSLCRDNNKKEETML